MTQTHLGHMIKKLILCLIIALGASFFALHFTSNLPSAYAIGCDSYGYLKQKQLFADRGFVGGLNTAVSDSEASFLVSVASKINTNFLTWSEVVAPHCHHYDQTTKQIVLQYPPGTGLILSLLPANKELQSLSVLMVLSTVLLYLITNTLAFTLRHFVISSFICYVMLAVMIKFQVASYSIPVTMLMLPWIALLTYFLKATTTLGNLSVALALGVLCGLLVDVRIASTLILPAVAGIFIAKLVLTPGRKSLSVLVAPVICLAFFGLTITPLLYANLVNVGGALKSTYAIYDRELRFNNLDLIINNSQYYLTDNLAAVVAVLTLAFLLLCRNASTLQHPPSSGINLIVLLLVFVGNLVFFCLKPVAIDYYFLPVSVFCLCFGLLDFSRGTSPLGRRRLPILNVITVIPCTLVLISFAGYRITMEPAQKVNVSLPDTILNKQAILYAGITGGTINYYFGKYSSKLDFGTHCIVEQLLTRVALAGKEQFIINDTPKMSELIQDIGIDKFEKIGYFKDSSASYEVYKFDDSQAAELPLISCDFSVNKQFASQIDLQLSGEVAGSYFNGLIKLTNNSHTSFSTRPVAGPVRLSWRFVDTEKINSPPPWLARKDLTMMVASGQSYDIPFVADLPKDKGKYRLEVTLVQEGFSWFQDYGMATSTQTVLIDHSLNDLSIKK